jgi:hypothetical protein
MSGAGSHCQQDAIHAVDVGDGGGSHLSLDGVKRPIVAQALAHLARSSQNSWRIRPRALREILLKLWSTVI